MDWRATQSVAPRMCLLSVVEAQRTERVELEVSYLRYFKGFFLFVIPQFCYTAGVSFFLWYLSSVTLQGVLSFCNTSVLLYCKGFFLFVIPLFCYTAGGSFFLRYLCYIILQVVLSFCDTSVLLYCRGFFLFAIPLLYYTAGGSFFL